jgi:aminoglycoside phosphotransferase (APT) family kinase protein
VSVPAQVAAALAGFAAGRALTAESLTVEPLVGGLTNRAWRVRAPGVDWVVRCGGGRDEALAIDRSAELVALRAAAPAGLAPPVIAADPARGTLVLGYVVGQVWTRERARSAEGIREIAPRIAALHALAVPPGLPPLDAPAQLRRYLEGPVAGPGPVPRAVLAARVEAALARYAPRGRVPCHHDLHHLNVVATPAGPVFIDWEYAAVGDPLLDLAAYAAYHELPPAGVALLLEGAGRADDRGAFPAALAVFDCLQALWYDAAGAWHALEAGPRAALVRRLTSAAPAMDSL